MARRKANSTILFPPSIVNGLPANTGRFVLSASIPLECQAPTPLFKFPDNELLAERHRNWELCIENARLREWLEAAVRWIEEAEPNSKTAQLIREQL
jgi:hypothetical protein